MIYIYIKRQKKELKKIHPIQNRICNPVIKWVLLTRFLRLMQVGGSRTFYGIKYWGHEGMLY